MEKIQSPSEEIFDILLRDALIAKYKDEADRFCKLSAEFESTKIFEKNIIKIRHSVNKEKRIKFFLNFIKNTAIITVSVISLIFAGLMTQPAVYAAVENVIKEIFGTHDSYTYQGQSEDNEFDKNKRLVYIPYDYELRSAFYSDSDIILTYKSKSDMYMYFEYGSEENSQISIDNERHDYYEIRNNDVVYYFYEAKEENSFSTLLWYSGGYYYSIDAQLSADELVKIAENIK